MYEQALRDYDQLKHEVLFAGPQFEQLLETAITTCLSSPERYYELLEEARSYQPERTDEHALLSQLGLWGVRSAIEISDMTDWHHWSENDGEARPDGPVHAPDAFSMPRDQDIVDKIEAFGAALVEEAFDCLGDDAPEQMEKLKAAESDEEVTDVLIWLRDRVRNIQRIARGEPESDNNDEEDEEEDEDDESDEEPQALTFYHPARLSPKLIGRYPDNKLDPTCLAVSMLSAAFFAKAELPQLHAGVAVSDRQYARMLYISSVSKLVGIARSHDLPIPDDLLAKLAMLKLSNEEIIMENMGYHAANLVRLPYGKWLQQDINFHRAIIFHESNTPALDDYYQRLYEIGEVQSGTEHLLGALQEGGLKPNDLLDDAIEAGRLPKLEWLFNMLGHEDLDADYDQLAERYVLPVLWRPGDPQLASYWEKCEGQEDYYGDLLSKKSFMQTAKDMIRKYVVWSDEDDALHAMLERCRHDEAYRRRRAEDLRAVPLYMTNALNAELCDSVLTSRRRPPHRALEVGLHEFRIGAAVLSDFSVYTQPLPQAFWATYWPSRVVTTEHFHTDADSADLMYGLRLGTTAMTNILNYPHADAIIIGFLERCKIVSREEDTQDGENRSGAAG